MRLFNGPRSILVGIHWAALPHQQLQALRENAIGEEDDSGALCIIKGGVSATALGAQRLRMFPSWDVLKNLLVDLSYKYGNDTHEIVV